MLGKSAPQRTPYRSLQRNKAVIYHDTDTNCKALGFFTEYCCFCRKSALNLFCHLSEAVEVQGILLFQELDCDVAVGHDVRLGQVFRLLQKSVIQEHAVVGQRKLLVPDLTLKWVGFALCGSPD